MRSDNAQIRVYFFVLLIIVIDELSMELLWRKSIKYLARAITASYQRMPIPDDPAAVLWTG